MNIRSILERAAGFMPAVMRHGGHKARRSFGIVPFAFGIPDFGLLVVKVLAVVGGVAVGALGCGWFAKLIVRVVTHQKLPPRMVTGFRILGGLAMGLLIWTWVFSAGGVGGMGGSGSGWWPFGQAGGKGVALEKQVVAPPPPPPQAQAEPPQPEKTDILAVRMLGGARVKEQRFYVLEDEGPRDFADLQKAIEERKQKQPTLGRLDILIYSDSVDRDNPAVTELARWAREKGLQTRLSIVNEKSPEK